MANLAQVVAAAAGGALWIIATMLVIRVYDLERRADREQRIEAVARVAVDSVEALLQHDRSDGRPSEPRDDAEPDGAMEIRARAHLRLVPSGAAASRHLDTACRADGSGPLRGR